MSVPDAPSPRPPSVAPGDIGDVGLVPKGAGSSGMVTEVKSKAEAEEWRDSDGSPVVNECATPRAPTAMTAAAAVLAIRVTSVDIGFPLRAQLLLLRPRAPARFPVPAGSPGRWPYSAGPSERVEGVRGGRILHLHIPSIGSQECVPVLRDQGRAEGHHFHFGERGMREERAVADG